MEVVLLERIEKLGQMGDVVRVKDGFARNFLLPRRKALRATKENMARFETQRAQLEVNNLARRGEAAGVAKKLEGFRLTVLRQASEGGQLYGSVAARDVSIGLTEAGFTVDKRQIELPNAIKTIGMHAARVALHPEVIVDIQLNVARSEAEADAQAAGRAIGREAEEPALEQFFESPDLAADAADETDTDQNEETAAH